MRKASPFISRLYKRWLCLCLLLVLTTFTVKAQFPVTGNLSISGQDIPYLEDHLRDNPAKLFYTLFLNDPNRETFDVILRITISGNGVNITTDPNYFGPIITLRRGQPTNLTGADLAEYFYPDHLMFSGISKEQFITGGRLPEGGYTICIEAYDINRFDELGVSNVACAQGIMQVLDPPALIRPLEAVDYLQTQYYIFEWQPLHNIGFPVEYTVYLFEKIDGFGDNDYLSIAAPLYVRKTMGTQLPYTHVDPLLRSGVDYIYFVHIRDLTDRHVFKNNGYSAPGRFLLDDRPCIVDSPCDDNDPCTVDDIYDENCNCIGTVLPDSDGDGVCDELDQCVGNDLVDADSDGIPDECDENVDCREGLMCDDGNPDTEKDMLDADCNCVGVSIPTAIPEAPIAMAATAVDKISFTAHWQEVGDQARYFDLELSTDSLFEKEVIHYNGEMPLVELYERVNGVVMDKPYYYRISASNRLGTSGYSNVIRVAEKDGCSPTEDYDYECGTQGGVEAAGMSQTLIRELNVGDEIYAADFKVKIDELSGVNPYGGRGRALLPMGGGKVHLNLKFAEIVINENCQLIDGYMEVSGAGANIVNEVLRQKLQQALSVLDDISGGLDKLEEVLFHVNDYLNLQETVRDYFSGGWNLMEGGDGMQREYPYLPDGIVSEVDAAIGCIEQAVALGRDIETCKAMLETALMEVTVAIDQQFRSKVQIPFMQSNSQQYAYDDIDYASAELRRGYQMLTISEELYKVHYKSIEAGQHDVFLADETGKGDVSIRYETNTKEVLQPMGRDGEKQLLELQAGVHNEHSQVYAVAESSDSTVLYAGKLNVLSFDRKVIDLHIVPVNGVNYPFDRQSLIDRLNEIYAPAIVTVNVHFDEGITVEGFDGELSDAVTGTLQNYTDEMDRINDQVNRAGDDAYYLFLVDGHESNNKLGYWPKGRPFGYLFHDNNVSDGEEQYELTIAHELGHGAFQLYHIYEDFPQLQRGSTDNLMDYGGGDRLYAYQWQFIHNPKLNWNLDDADEEGERILSLSNQNDNVNTWVTWDYDNADWIKFITPAGTRFTIESNVNGYPVKFGLKVKQGGKAFLPGVVSRLQIYSTEKGQYELYSGWYINSETQLFEGYARGKHDSESGKNDPDGLWLETSSEITTGRWLSARKQSDGCSLDVLSAENFSIPNYERRQVIPQAIDISTFNEVLERKELSVLDCRDLGNVFVFNYSSTALDTVKLHALYSGADTIQDAVAGYRHDTKFRLFITDQTTRQDQIDLLNELKSAFEEEVIWIHDRGDKYILRSMTSDIENLAGYYEGIEYNLDDFLDHLGFALSELPGAVYELADFVSRNIEKMKIPEYVWNPADANYDNKYYKVYEFILLPVEAYRAPIREGVQVVFEFELPGPTHEFAFMCGIWNGGVDIVKSLPDLIKIVGLFDAEKRAEFIGLWNNLKNYERVDSVTQEVYRGPYHAIKDAIAADFGEAGSVRFYHSISSYGIGIVIIFIQPQSSVSSISARALNGILILLQRIETLTDRLIPFDIVIRYTGRGLDAIKRGATEAVFTIRNEVFKGRVLLAGRLEEMSIPMNQLDLATDVVQNGDQLVLKYGGNNYQLASKTDDAIIAVSLGISESLYKRYKLAGLREIEIRDLINRYEGIDITPEAIINYVDNFVGENKAVFLRDLSKSTDFGKWVLENGDRVKAWDVLVDVSGSVAKVLRKKPKVLSSISQFADEGIEMTFESVGDGVRILNKNGDEVGRYLDDGLEGALEISDDFFVEAGSAVHINAITVKGNTGETFINAAFVKKADGTVGFIEDVTSYGAQVIQNAIKRRGRLRASLSGITKAQDAHHLVPVQVLKQNPVAKKAVEGGFDFNNGAVNGLPIDKFVKATGVGRHGPHPRYTQQILDYLDDWATRNPGYTAQMAKDELIDVANQARSVIQSTTDKINLINLGL